MAKNWPAIIAGLQKLIGEVGPMWPKSTKLAGFASDGPYHCEDCKYLNEEGTRCNQPVMMADPEVKHDKDGLGIITKPDVQCCEWVENKKEDLVQIDGIKSNSPKKTLAYFVRHGSTTDSAKNIFRGQRDSALDKKGFVGAHDLKDFFKDKEWDRVFCSPMMRAIQTATIICDDQEDYQPEKTDGLEPWNIGEMTGKAKTPENKKIMQGYIENADESPEGGESRHEFEKRVWPILSNAIQMGWKQGKPPIVVVHSSIIHSLCHLLEGERHENVAVEPGGVVEVYFDDGEILHRPVFKKGSDDSSLDPKNAS